MSGADVIMLGFGRFLGALEGGLVKKRVSSES